MPTPVFVIAVSFLLLFHFFWMHARSRYLLQKWASDNGYTLRNGRMRLLKTGPFLPPIFTGATVLQVSMADARGQLRQGYALCGNLWVGLFARDVQVHFEN